jgi:hypothetical protein
MARSLHANVLPHLQKGGMYEGKLSVVTWIYPQPLSVVIPPQRMVLSREHADADSHYVSPVVTEALMVFGSSYPDQFWDYMLAVSPQHRA